MEQRLNYKLPQPLRELYLVLGDYACEKKDTYFCRPEELHWSGQYLLVEAMERTRWGWGIYRKDPYASVYSWERNGVSIYGEVQDEKTKSKAELLRVEMSGKNAGSEDYVVYAYTNLEKTLLILSFSAQEKYGMITREPVPYSFAEQVEEKTGMLFWSWNGQGRKRVEDKEREMQEAGLFKR